MRAIPLAAAALAAALATPAVAAVPVPRLTGPVVDQAGLLTPGEVVRLEALVRAARSRDGGEGVQLQILLVRTTGGEPIESFSMRAAEAWRIGTKGKDDGVLVTVAVEDRAVRIEVGGGLEGRLTDAQSARIIRQAIVPAFQTGRYGDGLQEAAVQILGALGALPATPLRAGGTGGGAMPTSRYPAPDAGPRPGFVLWMMGVVFSAALLLLLAARSWSRRGWASSAAGSSGGDWDAGGSGSSGSSGSDRSGDGGSWSGEGGSFSGGGASGHW